MSVFKMAFAEPFFTVKYLKDEEVYEVGKRSILLNLSAQSLCIQNWRLEQWQSVICTNTPIRDIGQAVLIEDFERHGDNQLLMENIRQKWPLAYEIRREERLKGVAHYMSPKAKTDDMIFSMYHSASVPLLVGLHKDHWHGRPMHEIHTQIIGLGKMQQCLAEDTSTLFLEEPMAPGVTHKPMFDEQGNYPWHQFETTTPSVFMAVEMFPEL